MLECWIIAALRYFSAYGHDPLFLLTWGFFLFFCCVFVYCVFKKIFARFVRKEQISIPSDEKNFDWNRFENVSQQKSNASIVSSSEKRTSHVDYGRLSGEDVVATKLDLAHAYIEMGDQDRAREVLESVLQEGSDAQKHEAKNLLADVTKVGTSK